MYQAIDARIESEGCSEVENALSLGELDSRPSHSQSGLLDFRPWAVYGYAQSQDDASRSKNQNEDKEKHL